MQGSPAKLLGKLGPKPNRFDRAPSGAGGITSIDVAHAIGCNRDRAQGLLLRVKWAGDIAALPMLVETLSERMRAKARRQRWVMRKPDTIERVIVLALRECLVVKKRMVLTSTDSPFECGAEKCRGCGGVGRRYSTRQDKIIACERCEGSGERRWTDAERAGSCGLHHSVWGDNWSSRYDGVLDVIRVMERRALQKISERTAEAPVDFIEAIVSVYGK